MTGDATRRLQHDADHGKTHEGSEGSGAALEIAACVDFWQILLQKYFGPPSAKD
jgi:hypothetical protein